MTKIQTQACLGTQKVIDKFIYIRERKKEKSRKMRVCTRDRGVSKERIGRVIVRKGVKK